MRYIKPSSNVKNINSFLYCLIIGILFTSQTYSQNKSIQFNGTQYCDILNSGINSTLNFTIDSFTIESWIYPTNFVSSSNSYEHTILGNDNTSNIHGSGYVLRTGGSHKLSFAYSNGSGWREVTSAMPVINIWQWQHVAVTKAGGDIRLYVNGKLVGSYLYTTNNNVASSTNTIKIGENGSINNRKFTGLMDEIKIWNEARTFLQIQQDMAETCPVFPNTLVAYYKLDDTGTSNINTFTCINNATLNGIFYAPIASETGAVLYHGGGTILYVDSAKTAVGCGVQDGFSWTTSFSELSTAIEIAQIDPAIEKIYVAKGTYYPRTNPYIMVNDDRGTQTSSANNSDKTFHLRTGLEVYGGFPNGGAANPSPSLYRTILDGAHASGLNDTVYTVVYMDTSPFWQKVNDTTKLIGFTIKNGNALYGTGGISCHYGTELIQNCVLTNNITAIVNNANTICLISDTCINNYKNAISNTSNIALIQNCYLSNNNPSAIYTDEGVTTIINNEIKNNIDCGIYQTGGQATIIGNHIHHNGNGGIRIEGASSRISNNIITDHNVTGLWGNMQPNGGGIFLYGNSHTVTNNTILRDTASYGGGIYFLNAISLTLSNNLLSDNIAFTEGGGAWCNQGYNKKINNNIITHNKAFNGGGLFISSGLADTIIGNMIVENMASYTGGGMMLSSDNYIAANNVIANNQAQYAGGAYCGSSINSSYTLLNNTFYNNQATDTTAYIENAGGLLTWLGQCDILNNIFWGNKYGSMETVQKADYCNETGTNTFKNNVLQLPVTNYTMTDTGWYGIGLNAGTNLFGVMPIFTNTNNIAGTDGIFGTSDDGLQLHNSSPAIDFGNNNFLPAFITNDIKNDNRIYGSNVDAGAYELGCLPSNISTQQQSVICTGNSTILQVNSAMPYDSIKWYIDTFNMIILDTGYYYNTPVLNNNDTFWVSANGCSNNQRIPVVVNVINPTTSTQNITACDSFFSNIRNQYLTTSGVYIDTISNFGGCDSIVTLNLSITNATASIIQNGSTLQATPGATSYQWLTCNPYQIISGAISSTYLVTSNGDYTVAITQNNCTDTASCVNITNLGTNEKNPTKSSVQIIPNPSKDGIFTLLISNSTSKKELDLDVFNSIGQEIINKKINIEKSVVIDLGKYPNGLYYIEIKDKEIRYFIKLTKQ